MNNRPNGKNDMLIKEKSCLSSLLRFVGTMLFFISLKAKGRTRVCLSDHVVHKAAARVGGKSQCVFSSGAKAEKKKVRGL